MNNYIDISIPIKTGVTPVWPGSPEIKIDYHKSFKNGDLCNDRNLSMNLHTGTHIESAEHCIDQGLSVDSIGLDSLIGDCFVADLTFVDEINKASLQKLSIPKGINRILFKTKNSSNLTNVFNPNFIALTKDGAEWIVDNKFILCGNDYLSIQAYKGDPEVHRILMRNKTVILEGINLENVNSGIYELICLPMKLLQVEASPVRAILKKKASG